MRTDYLDRLGRENIEVNAPTIAQNNINNIWVGLLVGFTLLMIGWWVVYHNNWLTK